MLFKSFLFWLRVRSACFGTCALVSSVGSTCSPRTRVGEHMHSLVRTKVRFVSILLRVVRNITTPFLAQNIRTPTQLFLECHRSLKCPCIGACAAVFSISLSRVRNVIAALLGVSFLCTSPVLSSRCQLVDTQVYKAFSPTFFSFFLFRNKWFTGV